MTNLNKHNTLQGKEPVRIILVYDQVLQEVNHFNSANYINFVKNSNEINFVKIFLNFYKFTCKFV